MLQHVAHCNKPSGSVCVCVCARKGGWAHCVHGEHKHTHILLTHILHSQTLSFHFLLNVFLGAGVFPVTCHLSALCGTRHISHFTVSLAAEPSVAVRHFSHFLYKRNCEKVSRPLGPPEDLLQPLSAICLHPPGLRNPAVCSHMMFFYTSKDRPEEPAATPLLETVTQWFKLLALLQTNP